MRSGRKLGKIPLSFSKTHLLKIFKAMDNKKDTRNMVASFCGLKLGLRVGEVANFTLAEIEWSTGCVNKVNTKAGTPRSLPMDKIFYKVISLWCGLLSKNTNYVFPSVIKLHEHIRSESFSNAFREYLGGVGLLIPDYKRADGRVGHRYSFHNLRKTFCSVLVNSGAPLMIVKSLMGHSKLAITEQYYIHLSGNEKRKEMEKAFGVTRPEPPTQQKDEFKPMQQSHFEAPKRNALYELEIQLVNGEISVDDYKQKVNVIMEAKKQLQSIERPREQI